MGGITLTSSQLLLKCAHKASLRASSAVAQIKAAIEEDSQLRAEGKPVGFTESIRLNKLTADVQDRLQIRLNKFNLKEEGEQRMEVETETIPEESNVISLDSDSAVIFPMENPDKVKWVPEDDDEADCNVEVVVEKRPKLKTPTTSSTGKKKNKKTKTSKSRRDHSSDSEEESTIILN